jgi:uncharacterized protein (UPF0332 family)
LKPEAAAFLQKAREFLLKAQDMLADEWPDEASAAHFLGRTYNLKVIADYATDPASEVTVTQAEDAIVTAERFIKVAPALLA